MGAIIAPTSGPFSGPTDSQRPRSMSGRTEATTRRSAPSPERRNLSVILDIEGSAPQRAVSARFGLILPTASAAVATAALLVIAARPHDSAPRFVETGPSILEQAFAKPKPLPTLDLALPTDLAVEVLPQRVDGIYGPARPAPTVRSFR